MNILSFLSDALLCHEFLLGWDFIHFLNKERCDLQKLQTQCIVFSLDSVYVNFSSHSCRKITFITYSNGMSIRSITVKDVWGSPELDITNFNAFKKGIRYCSHIAKKVSFRLTKMLPQNFPYQITHPYKLNEHQPEFIWQR